MDRIDAEEVHETYMGAGVKVAINDSGIDYTHPDLDDGCAGGYYFLNVDAEAMDDFGHGTHVAGIVAVEDNGMGVIGVAPRADLYALKVLNAAGIGYTSDVIAALEWSIDPDGNADTGDDPMQAINMSIGWSGSARSLEDACDATCDAGTVLVAAAGNWARTVPAACDSVIAVAGSDGEDKIPASWSNGNYIELTAPGVDLYSTWPTGMTSSTYDPQPECDDNACYKYASGTSMASPHVAGTVAPMIAGGVADPGVISTTLQSTADRLMPNPNVEYADSYQGYGLVDAGEAVIGTEDGND